MSGFSDLGGRRTPSNTLLPAYIEPMTMMPSGQHPPRQEWCSVHVPLAARHGGIGMYAWNGLGRRLGASEVAWSEADSDNTDSATPDGPVPGEY